MHKVIRVDQMMKLLVQASIDPEAEILYLGTRATEQRLLTLAHQASLKIAARLQTLANMSTLLAQATTSGA